MHRIITILIFLIACTEGSYSQPSFDNELLSLEKEIFRSKNDSDRVGFHLKKLDLYIEHNDFSELAFQEVRRIDYRLFRDSIDQKRFLWNASLISQLNGALNTGRHYNALYQQHYPDSSIAAILLGIMLNSQSDTAYTNKWINHLVQVDARFEGLSCMNAVIEFEIPNKNLYVVASAILPGLGSALNGDVFKGLNSLAINGAAGYGLYLLAQNNLYLNTILWGGGLGLKFYFGNLKLTNRLVESKQARIKNSLADSCNDIYKDLLTDYPIQPK
ncbi:MAG: hypothetical protein JKX76_03710 [Colwellia sp.]|nr:hypothetical protein [Colwellia sp.]